MKDFMMIFIGPDYGDFGTGFGSIREAVFFPGEGNFDHSLWHANSSELWGGKSETLNQNQKNDL